MSYMLYEVWSRDDQGHEELVETTASLVAAKKIAQQIKSQDLLDAVIYRETEDGDCEVILVLDKSSTR